MQDGSQGEGSTSGGPLRGEGDALPREDRIVAKEDGESGPSSGVTCPNCGEVAPGLYSNTCYGVLHCGCFYEKDASAVRFHV